MRKKKATSIKSSNFLGEILSHPDVSLLKKTPNGYIIKVKEQHWRISENRHTKLTEDIKSTDEIFFGDPKKFYNRFVVMSYTPEENSGKKWTKDEDDILEDMINDDYHIGDIASELKRDITSIALRGSKYAGVDSKGLVRLGREQLHYTRFSEL